MPFSFIQDTARNDEITVGTTNTRIAEARQTNKKRKVILIRNTSTGGQTISINLGMSQAENGKGIVLKQNESFSDSSEAGYDAFQGTINAISDAAGGKLSILER